MQPGFNPTFNFKISSIKTQYRTEIYTVSSNFLQLFRKFPPLSLVAPFSRPSLQPACLSSSLLQKVSLSPLLLLACLKKEEDDGTVKIIWVVRCHNCGRRCVYISGDTRVTMMYNTCRTRIREGLQYNF
jgi:hypothetical protein